ncbi:laccase, putative [Ricinus communis]|uniref:laccase n=1 Tax=Ricinus communis TaxID=3988 RepID=B9SMB0_RICCO|nr:laccase, putative [Ricinus communis]
MGFVKKNLVPQLLLTLVLNILLLCMAEVHYYDFVLKESNFTKLCSSKNMLAVNESFPGPVLTVRRGDLVYVNVHNRGKYGVTIHWHGVRQPRNPWSDGPEYVTQCPIQPGSNFTHEIILSDEEGTLWWHAHSDWSRATVHGAFVILPPEGKKYPFPEPDEEQIIVLGSWYKGDVMTIYNDAKESGGNPKDSDAHTINGYTGSSTDCPSGEMFRMNVTQGKTYLLRIINAAMNVEQFFGIAGHNLTLVGMDAAYTKHLNYEYLMITPGQTMDVLFTANQSPTVIKYQGDYTPPSFIPSPNLPDLRNATAAVNFTASLKSLANSEHPVSVPEDITRHIFIAISLNVLPCVPEGRNCSGPKVDNSSTIISASLNNISFATPSVDILDAYYSLNILLFIAQEYGLCTVIWNDMQHGAWTLWL